MEYERFRDFDEFAESVRDVDARMLFQNPTRRSWEINHLNLPQVHVQLGRLGSGNIVEGVSRPDGYLLYLPLTRDCEYRANGVIVPRYSFMAIEPGSDFCVATKYEHDWCTIVVPSEMIESSRGEDDPPKKRCYVTRPNRRVAEALLSQVCGPLETAAAHPEFEGSPAATRASSDLVELGKLVLRGSSAEGTSPRGRPRASRDEIIGRVMEHLEESKGVRPRVADLASAADVTERTLQTAFHEYYGVGPTGYLQLRTLHQVRRGLRAADPEGTTVAEVLLQHGVWELGRFAGRYRRQFGELPSETLRQKPR